MRSLTWLMPGLKPVAETSLLHLGSERHLALNQLRHHLAGLQRAGDACAVSRDELAATVETGRATPYGYRLREN